MQPVLVYSGPSDVYSTVDATVEPGVQYRYCLEAGNAGGSSNSSWVTVTLPEVTPALISAIMNLTAVSSESVYIAWNHLPNSTIDQYRVMMNDESFGHQSEWPANSTTASLVITGLRPFTWYYARLSACIRGVPNGCGTNPMSERVRTWEAPPTDQPPPVLTSTGPTTVIVSWQPPVSPNGVILLYRIRRREWVESSFTLSESGLLINLVNGSVHTFTNAGVDLRPFTVYEYSITAVNSQGDATSNWTSVRTLEAAPQGMSAPVVSTVGRYTFFTTWEPPAQPNGQIHQYEVEYGAHSSVDDVSKLHVSATTLNASVSGVHPYTEHSVRVRAVNSAGSAVSTWTNFTTLPASPSGLGAISMEQVLGGRSVILSWSPPTQPNGRVLNYAVYTDTSSNTPVYSGVNLQYELAGLEPYSNYSVQLKACTVAGCTRSPWQRFTTLQAPPANQRTPSVDFVNASSVLIAWSRPADTFGDILSYNILRKTLPVGTGGRTKRSEVDYTVIYTTTNTTSSYFAYLDTTVLPFTR